MRGLCNPNSVEHGGERTEGVRLDDVDADVEERRVQVPDHVGTGEAEDVDAALVRRAAVVVERRLAEMEVRADSAVEDDDTLVHLVQERHPIRLPAGPSARPGLLSATAHRLRGG